MEAALNKPTKVSNLSKAPINGTKNNLIHSEVIDNFMSGIEMENFYTYNWTTAKHIYETRKDCTELWLFKDNPSVKFEICVAKKINGCFIGNSSSLIAQKYQNGNISWLSGRSKIQEILFRRMPMVPFRLFEQQGLDLPQLKIVDRGPEEWLDVGNKEPRHFMGAMLFRIEETHYLFDLDRGDIAQKNFNPFLAKLSRFSKTIDAAYKALKPDEVYQAEEEGKKCFRQGEWFFIPVKGEYEPLKARDKNDQRATLATGQSRPHYVEQISEEGYVTGKVTHGGFEHKSFVLKGWYQTLPNTAIESFKISGDVD